MTLFVSALWNKLKNTPNLEMGTSLVSILGKKIPGALELTFPGMRLELLSPPDENWQWHICHV